MAGMVARIDLEIEVPWGFPEKYLPARLRAAELCAVKKHLDHAAQFVVGTVSVEAQPT
ncbi:MAG TPA: hypothetical protein VJK02_12535 [Anaerolineales bacterium]|nr:hypothetical protein [Anaerolineales bacterium]